MNKNFNVFMDYDDIETAYTEHQYPNAECMVSDTNDVPSTYFVPPNVKMIPFKATENGEYYASQYNADGFDMVEVDVEGGSDPNIEPLTDTITVNGTHTYAIEEGVDGYYPVTMNVNVQPELGGLYEEITTNGRHEYGAPTSFDGYNRVRIDVNVQPTLEDKTVTDNGTYTAGTGYDGLGEVTVNVQPTLEDKTVTTNGTYTAGTGYDGLGEVTVNVQPTLESKNITANGTYTPSSGYDGFSSVEVDVSAIPSDCIIVENAKCCDSTTPITVTFDTPLTSLEGYIVSIYDTLYPTEPSINFFQYYRNESKYFFLNKSATDSASFSITQTTISGSFSTYRDRWISIYKVPSDFYCNPIQ